MKQNLVFDKEQLFLSVQDYKRVFFISTVMILAPTVIFLGFQMVWDGDIYSIIMLKPLAWVLVCTLLFLPVVLVLRIIVTRKLKKMIQQLEEEIQQQEERTLSATAVEE
ncbi:hypothetical protein [Bartonella taylorii]|uniref:hypothetical protein n=1 Tax=Bartonella taylorii TaxID=33046 RepID=UPI001ABB2DA3|nr:hypothetical protein [Bartonella taylorii]